LGHFWTPAGKDSRRGAPDAEAGRERPWRMDGFTHMRKDKVTANYANGRELRECHR